LVGTASELAIKRDSTKVNQVLRKFFDKRTYLWTSLEFGSTRQDTTGDEICPTRAGSGTKTMEKMDKDRFAATRNKQEVPEVCKRVCE
jgi:hypothetical protein